MYVSCIRFYEPLSAAVEENLLRAMNGMPPLPPSSSSKSDLKCCQESGALGSGISMPTSAQLKLASVSLNAPIDEYEGEDDVSCDPPVNTCSDILGDTSMENAEETRDSVGELRSTESPDDDDISSMIKYGRTNSYIVPIGKEASFLRKQKTYAHEHAGDVITWAPKAICILSHFPFLDQFRSCLAQLHTLSMSVMDVPLERWISHIVLRCPLPRPGGAALSLKIVAHKDPIILRLPKLQVCVSYCCNTIQDDIYS